MPVWVEDRARESSGKASGKALFSGVSLVCSRPGKEPKVAGEEILEGTGTRLHRI